MGVPHGTAWPARPQRGKRIYLVDLNEAYGTGLPLLTKTLARKPAARPAGPTGGMQEKVEGLTIGGDGRVYLVTNNDGVEDATGETVFLNLGSARKVLGR
jgi:hypothetical protein